MATIDMINASGGKAANFLDLGGTDDPERIKRGLDTVYNLGVDVILVNIFGGVTKADTVASVIDEFSSEHDIPIVARLAGSHIRDPGGIIKSERVTIARTMDEAVAIAVNMAKKSGINRGKI